MGKIEKRKVWMALIMVPPILLLISLGPPEILYLMVVSATFLGLREYYNLVLPHSKQVERIVGIGLGLILSIIISFGGMKETSPFFVLVLLILSILFMTTSKDLSSTISHIGCTLFGIFFIGFLLAYVSLIRDMTDGRLWVLFLIVTVWAGDISALLIGSLLGRHKLYPKISPKKTFEGLFGSIVGSIMMALAFSLFKQRTLYALGHRLRDLGAIRRFYRVDVEAKRPGKGFRNSHPRSWRHVGSIR